MSLLPHAYCERIVEYGAGFPPVIHRQLTLIPGYPHLYPQPYPQRLVEKFINCSRNVMLLWPFWVVLDLGIGTFSTGRRW